MLIEFLHINACRLYDYTATVWLIRSSDVELDGDAVASPAMGHWGTCPPPLELVQVVIFTLHVCSVAFPVHVILVT